MQNILDIWHYANYKYFMNINQFTDFLSNNPCNVFIPFLFAILAIFSAGSIPNILIFFFFNRSNNIPSFEPMSTTNELSSRLKSFISESA